MESTALSQARLPPYRAVASNSEEFVFSPPPAAPERAMLDAADERSGPLSACHASPQSSVPEAKDKVRSQKKRSTSQTTDKFSKVRRESRRQILSASERPLPNSFVSNSSMTPDLPKSFRLPVVFAANQPSRVEQAVSTRQRAEQNLALFTAEKWQDNAIFLATTKELALLDSRQKTTRSLRRHAISLSENIALSADGFRFEAKPFLSARLYRTIAINFSAVYLTPCEIAFAKGLSSTQDALLDVASRADFSLMSCSRGEIKRLLQTIGAHTQIFQFESRDEEKLRRFDNRLSFFCMLSIGVFVPIAIGLHYWVKEHPKKLKKPALTEEAVIGWAKLTPNFSNYASTKVDRGER